MAEAIAQRPQNEQAIRCADSFSVNLRKAPAFRQALASLHRSACPLNRQAMPSFESPSAKNRPPVGSSGPGSEAMHAGTAAFLGLVRSLRHIKDTLQVKNYMFALHTESRQPFCVKRTPSLPSTQLTQTSSYQLQPRNHVSVLPWKPHH